MYLDVIFPGICNTISMGLELFDETNEKVETYDLNKYKQKLKRILNDNYEKICYYGDKQHKNFMYLSKIDKKIKWSDKIKYYLNNHPKFKKHLNKTYSNINKNKLFLIRQNLIVNYEFNIKIENNKKYRVYFVTNPYGRKYDFKQYFYLCCIENERIIKKEFFWLNYNKTIS